MTGAEHRILHAAMRLFADRGGTQVAVSDLAKEAGIARGTIYNNISDVCGLYDAVCNMMADEMAENLTASVADVYDPAQKLSDIVRLCLRRVHEEPHWGRFIARYAMGEPRLGSYWRYAPAEELRKGLASGRFEFAPEQVASITATFGGATFGAMTLILNGNRTWRQAGTDTAELLLRSVGLPRDEARILASTEISPLPRIEIFKAA
ncbi:TetR/AcrR family transcriptional regulator [Phaeobacter marinintestinus]|uniref:TetR/AcrR family transcriptional regulator n=1 Tax=Falsiphaeobacter marinintestinus TaxID=1492905 RepID=UPI0011B413E6|nr:TetR/AcrR family transcriptional regulator [Phaeobacter marinintestinus]